MASDKTLFAPVPLRAMANDLSGLQLRTLVCVSAHDRLSLVKGKGQGCRASNVRMAEMVGCSFARLCSTLTELTDAGYLQKEKLGRHTVYRVIYTDDDRLLFGNVSGSRARSDRLPSRGVTGCQHSSETDANLPETASQYISLNEGIDLEESREESSVETARFAARDAQQDDAEPNIGAYLARFERAFKAYSLNSAQMQEWSDWFERYLDEYGADTDDNYYRAQRLEEALHERMDMAAWETNPSGHVQPAYTR